MNELNSDSTTIYAGPDLIQFGVMRFQVYTNGLPEFVSRAIEKIPEIKNLIVSVEDLEKTRAKLDTTGSYENAIFKKIQKAANALKNKPKKEVN